MFGQDFGISNVIYTSKGSCDDTCGNLDETALNNQIVSQYVNDCSRIVCPCNDCGLKIDQNVEAVAQGILKITFIIWYNICDKINYDVYYGETNCVSCNPCYPPSINLCFYDSVFASPCDDCCRTQKKAIRIATQILV
jgi:hypothetical protein